MREINKIIRTVLFKRERAGSENWCGLNMPQKKNPFFDSTWLLLNLYVFYLSRFYTTKHSTQYFSLPDKYLSVVLIKISVIQGSGFFLSKLGLWYGNTKQTKNC